MKLELISKLHGWQLQSAERLSEILFSSQAAVDFSDTGTGKTFTAVAVAQHLGLPTLVVCPKVVISAWSKVAEYLGEELSVINYEKLRTGKTPFGQWIGRVQSEQYKLCTSCGDKILPGPRGRSAHKPVMEPCKVNANGVHVFKKKRIPTKTGVFEFSPQIGLIIFDEVHRCSGLHSQNAEMLIAAKRQGLRILGLSATAACSPLQMRALGYVLGMHADKFPRADQTDFWRWSKRYGCGIHPIFGGWHWLVGHEKQRRIMEEIHAQIIPSKGVRVRITNIPNFPERQVTADAYNIDTPEKIDRAYTEMSGALAAWKARMETDKNPAHPLTIQLRARQQIELLKVPILVDLTEDYLAKELSVAIFVNFTATVQELCRRLKTTCVVDGTSEFLRYREFNIDAFSSDEQRVIICNSAAGGVGISLHDTAGKHPRVGLISPGWSAVVLQQVLGRLHREGGKSTAFYRLVFVADSVESKIQRSVARKLSNLEALNDGDLTIDE